MSTQLVKLDSKIGYKEIFNLKDWDPIKIISINELDFTCDTFSNDGFYTVTPYNGENESHKREESSKKLRVNLRIESYDRNTYNEIRNFAYLTIWFFTGNIEEFDSLKIITRTSFLNENVTSHTKGNNQVTIYLRKNFSTDKIVEIARKLDQFIIHNLKHNNYDPTDSLRPEDINFGSDHRINDCVYTSYRDENISTDNELHLDIISKDILRNKWSELVTFFREISNKYKAEFRVLSYNYRYGNAIKVSKLIYAIITSYDMLQPNDRANFLQRFPELREGFSSQKYNTQEN